MMSAHVGITQSTLVQLCSFIDVFAELFIYEPLEAVRERCIKGVTATIISLTLDLPDWARNR